MINNKSIKKIFNLALSITAIALSFFVGSTSNFAKYKSNLMIAVETTKDDTKWTHGNVIYDGLTYKEARLLQQSCYAQNSKYNNYFKINETYTATLLANNYDINFASQNVFNDDKTLETIDLPLYRERNFAIRNGPINGAKYASYIPASLAVEIMHNNNLKSFAELLEKNYLLNVTVGEQTNTFSINNIYLDGDFNEWRDGRSSDLINKSKYSNYSSYFGKNNTNTLFVYAPEIFEQSDSIINCFDIKSSYGNLDNYITSTSAGSKLNLSYSLENDNKKILINEPYKLKNEQLFSTLSILGIIVTIILLFAFLIVLYASRSFSYRFNKILLISMVAVYMTFTLIITLIKIINVSFPILIVSNAFGNICFAVVALSLLTTLIIQKRRD